MKDFFHGWRRKVGTVTLLMALVLMGAWIRSDSVADFIIWPAVNRTDLFSSAECKLSWETHIHSAEAAGYPRWTASSFVSVATADEEEGQDAVWRFRFLGFEAGDFNFPNEQGGPFSFCCIPYGFIVIPLTLLSAYLLLWKPRTQHQGLAH